MNQSTSKPLPFESGWFSFGLAPYRPCKSTYCLYPYESVPPLPEAQFSGALQWLEPLDRDIYQEMQHYRSSRVERAYIIDRLEILTESAQQLGLSLPEPFLRFMASPEFQDRIPSCTDCHFDLPEKIVPCPGSENGSLIRFLNDQQFALLWYLYLTPQGEHRILVSHYRFYELAESPEYAEALSAEAQQKALKGVFECAPSFELFLYRFWLENVIWFNLDLGKPLSEEQKRYLSHYKSIERGTDAV